MNVGLVIVLSITIFLLIILSGIFSCSDIVYATVNQLKLKKESKNGSKTAKLALKFAENYDSTVVTILFSNNLVNIAASSLGTVLAYQIFNNAEFAPSVSTIVLLVLILVFGEILPKVIGRRNSYRLSKILAYPIKFLSIIFFPIVFITSNFGRLIAKIFIRKEKNSDLLSDEELSEMVETIEQEGVIDEDQSELIQSTIIFKETEAHEIMTPRVDMFAINIDEKIENILKKDDIFVHSRIPVFKDTIDNIIGILPAKRLLRAILAKEKIEISKLMVPVKFVPGAMGVSEILEKMKSSKIHVVIVTDEFGGTDGILTMEDILEELVGEMYDEMDQVHLMYKKIKRNQYLVDGDMNINDFFNLVEVEAPEQKDYTSVGGWVVDTLERFAKNGDSFAYKNLRITVKKHDEFTVQQILVRIVRKVIDD